MVNLEQEFEQALYAEYSRHITPHTQAQFSTTMQLKLLILAANKLGLYDGADAISRVFKLGVM